METSGLLQTNCFSTETFYIWLKTKINQTGPCDPKGHYRILIANPPNQLNRYRYPVLKVETHYSFRDLAVTKWRQWSTTAKSYDWVIPLWQQCRPQPTSWSHMTQGQLIFTAWETFVPPSHSNPTTVFM